MECDFIHKSRRANIGAPVDQVKGFLARAVAAECGAHLEVIAGPEISETKDIGH